MQDVSGLSLTDGGLRVEFMRDLLLVPQNCLKPTARIAKSCKKTGKFSQFSLLVIADLK